MSEVIEARPNAAFPPDLASRSGSSFGVAFTRLDHPGVTATMAGRRQIGPHVSFPSARWRSRSEVGEPGRAERFGSDGGVARAERADRRSADPVAGEGISREENPGDPVTAPQKESPGHKPTRGPRTPVPHHPRRSGIRCGALAKEGELRQPSGTRPAVALAPSWSRQWTTTTSRDGQTKEAAAVRPSTLPLPSIARLSWTAPSPGSAGPRFGTGVSRSGPATR